MFYLDIKNKRISKHLTQKQLARKIHISQTYFSKLERNLNPRTVNLGLIEDLAKALDCNGYDILKWKDNEQG